MRIDGQNGKDNIKKENVGEKRNEDKMDQCKDNEQTETHSKEPVHIRRSSAVVAGQARTRHARTTSFLTHTHVLFKIHLFLLAKPYP